MGGEEGKGGMDYVLALWGEVLVALVIDEVLPGLMRGVLRDTPFSLRASTILNASSSIHCIRSGKEDGPLFRCRKEIDTWLTRTR